MNTRTLPADLQAAAELSQTWREDCQRHYWMGILHGSVIIGLIWGIYILGGL